MPLKKAPSTMNTLASSMAQEVQVVSQVSQEELDEHMEGVSEVTSPIELDRGDAMAAASQEAEKVVENISKISSQRINVNQLRPQDVDDILDASIVARPLHLPDFLDQRAKDPNFRLRWVNFKGHGGSRYQQMLGAGFRNAKPEEVVGVNGSLTVDDSGIRYHDTILMIVPTKLLLGAYKHNFNRSVDMTSQQGSRRKAKAVADKEMQSLINSEHISPEYLQDPHMRSKVNFYVPGDEFKA